jgi:hypothetical protein
MRYKLVNLIPKELCDELIEENINNEFIHSNTSAIVDGIPHYADFYQSNLKPNKKLFHIIHKNLYSRYEEINSVEVSKFIKYEVGGKYDRHVESIKGVKLNDDNQTKDLIIVQLNNNYEGGEFQIYDIWLKSNRNEYETIRLNMGDVFMYKPYQHLQVNTITNGIKYEIYIFIKNKELIVKKSII